MMLIYLRIFFLIQQNVLSLFSHISSFSIVMKIFEEIVLDIFIIFASPTIYRVLLKLELQ